MDLKYLHVISTAVMDITSSLTKITKSISLGRVLSESEEVSDEDGEVFDEDEKASFIHFGSGRV
jgi:hypothetical protein